MKEGGLRKAGAVLKVIGYEEKKIPIILKKRQKFPKLDYSYSHFDPIETIRKRNLITLHCFEASVRKELCFELLF